MLTQLILALLAAVILGAALLLWGLRGRRINDHPTCRQCRFDLAGQPTPLITCPECGCGLKRPGWVVMGLRRRRPIAITLGVLLVALPVIALCSTMLAVAAGVDLYAHKPAGLLIFETRHGSPRLASSAAAELLARTTAGKLKGDPLTRAIDAALDIQADQTRPFPRELGDMIEQANISAGLSKDQRDRFLRQAPVLSWRARQRLLPGRTLPVVATLSDARIGDSSELASTVILTEISLDGELVYPATRSNLLNAMNALTRQSLDASTRITGFIMRGSRSRFMRAEASGEAMVLIPLPTRLRPGPHNAKVTLRVVTSQLSYTAPFRRNVSLNPAPNSIDISHEFQFDVLGPGESDITLIEPSPELNTTLERMLQPTDAWVNALNSLPGGVGTITQSVGLNFLIKNPPVDFAFDVVLKQDGQEHPFGTLTSGRRPAGDPTNHLIPFRQEPGRIMLNRRARGLTAGRADLILRPSVEAARSTLDIDRMYNGEIVIPDIELVDSRANLKQSTTPTSPSEDAATSVPTPATDSTPSPTAPTPEKP